MTVIWADLGWAFCYNLIALPLAAFGYLNPLFAGIAMSASSLIVVANSLRLRRFTPGRHRGAAGAGGAAPRRRPGRRVVRRFAGRGRGAVSGWPAEVVRAAAGPLVCAVVLIGLLTGWAAPHGAGTLTGADPGHPGRRPDARLHPAGGDAVGTAHAYLVIRNLARSPTNSSPSAPPSPARRLHSGRPRRPADPGRGPDGPGRGTLSLSPLIGGLLIEHPVPFENSRTVPLTLVFRHAGQKQSTRRSPLRELPEQTQPALRTGTRQFL